LQGQEADMNMFPHWLRAATRRLAWTLAVAVPWSAAASGFDSVGLVGRLADLQGEVSFYDPDRGEWTEALRNRPVIAGDRLVLGRGARAEIRVAGAVLLLADGADLDLLALDDEQLRLRLNDGAMALRLPTRGLADRTEILTPEARLRPQRAGDYRIDRDGSSTFAATRRGELEVSGRGNLLLIGAGERHEIWVDERRDVARSRTARWPQDRLAAWADEVWRADSRYVAPAHARDHLPEHLPGTEDLVRHGRWDRHPEYGALWFPVGVSAGWAPFRDGRWVWMRPWGWTWVDAAPWGFATSHYGHWVQWHGRWGWWAGPRHVRPVFTPAVVAWVGDANFSVSVRIGQAPPSAWVPLPPRHHYVPIVVHHPYPHVHPRPPQHRPPPRRLPPPSEPISRPPSVTYGTQGVPVDVRPVPAVRAVPAAPSTGVARPAPSRGQALQDQAPRPQVTYGQQGVPVGVKPVTVPLPVGGPSPGGRAAPVAGPAPVAPPAPARSTAPSAPKPAFTPAPREEAVPAPRHRNQVH